MTWFEPDDAPWQYVSRTLIYARLITMALWLGIPLIGLIVLGALTSPWVWTGAGALLIAMIWSAWVIVRQVTAHAWAEREDDLVVKRGRILRTVTVVPYGRMQYVEVESGPLARAFGIARVQLHTASPGTDANIAGVPEAEAARLRDRLTSRGEAQLAGL
ncbi:PH domain-containing protein [Demequina muriae]|uniref:PH domain-containing protein n=1 Tax=Demequina muriae TaxID=3051664 RepID=A0ABT8GFG0_9MICO|nr:PH domain-containing protein [Demequina sp. EGI L300058]MDN4480155.1 PH domain-containing protein [Demequina sp. EGI L300058]